MDKDIIMIPCVKYIASLNAWQSIQSDKETWEKCILGSQPCKCLKTREGLTHQIFHIRLHYAHISISQ